MNENNDIMRDEEKSEDTLTTSENEEITDKDISENNIPESTDDRQEEETQKASTSYAFEWKYTDELEAENTSKKKKKNPQKGALVYAVVMCVAFLLAFAILAASLYFDDFAGAIKTPDRVLSVTEIVEKGMPSTVMIVAAQEDNYVSGGSGFVVNEYGYVATNYHVVEESEQIVVIDSNNNQYSAELVNKDEKMDLAILYVEGLDAPVATLADSNAAQLGETVVAIGTPAGSGESLSVSNGIISGFNRSISVSNAGMIQTNAPLNPGNSGGPLFDSKGNVVGIVTAKMYYTSDFDGEDVPLDGIAYAIPINAAKEKITSWIAQDLTKPMLGIHAVSVEQGKSYFYCGAEGIIYEYVNELGQHYKINYAGIKTKLTKSEVEDTANIIITDTVATGLLVVNVTKGLGADGKLTRGDIVVELNGEKTASVTEVRGIFAKLVAGETVDVKIYRDGEPTAVKMTLKTKGDMLAAEKNSK